MSHNSRIYPSLCFQFVVILSFCGDIAGFAKIRDTEINLKLRKFYLSTLSCEISSSHGGEYDVQSCLLGCTAV
jgi:hypothetical protein